MTAPRRLKLSFFFPAARQASPDWPAPSQIPSTRFPRLRRPQPNAPPLRAAVRGSRRAGWTSHGPPTPGARICTSHPLSSELGDTNPRIAYSTKKAYAGYLEKWIEPRWGEYRLLEIRAVEVESWLKSLNRASGTRCKIRNVMSLLFNHGRRHDLCDRNPIQWVRQSAKRRSAPDILTRDEVQGLLANLRFRERTLVLLAVTTGLRRSELFALKWRDVDFQAKQIHVTRSIVQNVVGVCKTESSQKPVPVHHDLVETLRQWHRQTPYQSPESWVFASPVNQGRWPYLAQQIMRHHILPVARKLGISKRIGWHTFRHTYSTLLRATGAELKIMQELLRHSTIRVTLDTYTQAVTTAKRTAQDAVVALLFPEKEQETQARSG